MMLLAYGTPFESWMSDAAVYDADTLMLVFIVTLQPPGPEHAPPQPLNVEPPVGVAISDTAVPDP
jgi:hypothetical protein